ncbi:NUDIX hydrolase [Thermincola ferriacetica]|uniref:8-oxo-dGTP diphosphatase n=1 Tax=Thermincola ferriacetica TaxID=281456 RepID=A0A0L6W6Q9_9FIRM|nr:NUDIX hydrolase [Thermincola ferriacetica]
MIRKVGVIVLQRVTAAILMRDDKVFIAKRKANGLLAGKWEFPGGKIEKGESPEECLKREMKEEFHIEVSVGAFFGESIYHYEHGAIHLLAYYVQWEKGEFRPLVHDEFKWVPVAELKEYGFAPADIPLAEKLMKVLGG